MLKIICKKAANFAGKRYHIGEEIPTESVLPERIHALVSYGIIETLEVEEPKKPNPSKKESPKQSEEAAESSDEKRDEE